MEIFTFTNLYDLEVSSATFVRSDLATFTGLDELGLEVVGQHLEPERAVLACRAIDDDLGVSWNSANNDVLAEGERVLIETEGLLRWGHDYRGWPACLAWHQEG